MLATGQFDIPITTLSNNRPISREVKTNFDRITSLLHAGELLPSPTEVQIIESFRFHVGKLPLLPVSSGKSEITLNHTVFYSRPAALIYASMSGSSLTYPEGLGRPT